MAADLKVLAACYIYNQKIPYTSETLINDCIDLVEYFDCKDVVRKACKDGLSLDNIKYLIKVFKFNKWKLGIFGAAEGGHRELVDFFISKATMTTNYPLNWYVCGMYNAAKGGHKELIDFFITQGDINNINHWNKGMYTSAKAGHRDLVEFFISKGANNLNLGLKGALRGNHHNLIHFFIEKASSGSIRAQRRNWNTGMFYAALNCDRDLVVFFISKGANDWDLGMRGAAKGGHRELVDFFITLGAKDWYRGMRDADKGDHHDLVEFFKNKK